VHFINGAGNLHGTLSQTQGVTDAAGHCSTAFTATGISGFGRLAVHQVQVVAGTAPHLKARPAIIFAAVPRPVGGGHPGPGHR
ncbi:MAG TPA: hypothetical protein VNZ67_07125, partial [bacterium]|nr:hypothetical protein [bacterium]